MNSESTPIINKSIVIKDLNMKCKEANPATLIYWDGLNINSINEIIGYTTKSYSKLNTKAYKSTITSTISREKTLLKTEKKQVAYNQPIRLANNLLYNVDIYNFPIQKNKKLIAYKVESAIYQPSILSVIDNYKKYYRDKSEQYHIKLQDDLKLHHFFGEYLSPMTIEIFIVKCGLKYFQDRRNKYSQNTFKKYSQTLEIFLNNKKISWVDAMNYLFFNFKDIYQKNTATLLSKFMKQ